MSELAAKSRPAILIIDDVINNVETLGEILTREYTIQFATSGLEGLELIQKNAPDLILLDLMMPGMDGYEVIARLKSNPLTAKIPVIFVTAQNDSVNEIKGMSSGAVDFITKPIVPEIVRARVRAHLTVYQQELELRELNASLESKIKERTKQVEALNIALEERANQAEAANNAKSLFLGSMSHELRTPMTAIMGFSDLLLKNTTEPSAVQKLSQILKAAKSLSTTINEILDFSQIQSGQLTNSNTPFDLADLVSRVDDLMEERALAKKIHYSSYVDASIPSPLIGDSFKLEQILSNLISNAIKFTREGYVKIQIRLGSGAK